MGSVPIIEAHLFCPEEKAHIPTPDEPPSLPVRLMANATTVDENNDDSPICPSTLEDPDYAATSCVAIGLVVPSISDPEGEGVDEQSDCEGEAVDEQPRCDTRPQLVRSSAIIQFWIDYEDPDG